MGEWEKKNEIESIEKNAFIDPYVLGYIYILLDASTWTVNGRVLIFNQVEKHQCDQMKNK